MNECIKCGNRKITISYMSEGMSIPKGQVDWNSLFIIEELQEEVGVEDVVRVSEEHLYKKCDTCQYDWREHTKDNKWRAK